MFTKTQVERLLSVLADRQEYAKNIAEGQKRDAQVFHANSRERKNCEKNEQYWEGRRAANSMAIDTILSLLRETECEEKTAEIKFINQAEKTSIKQAVRCLMKEAEEKKAETAR